MKTPLLLICVIFTLTTSLAQRVELTNPEVVGISSSHLNEMKLQLHDIVDKGRLAGIQTAIISKGKLAYFDTYGFADINKKKTLNSNSIFRIFSMTKPITSIGLMQLYEKGKFKLEDPVHKYIPEFKNMLIHTEKGNIPAKNDIKIIDLLRHTSGIGYGRSSNSELNKIYNEANLNASKNLKEFINKISKMPLHFNPGTDWKYGYSTDICGYLIEVLSSKKLDDYLYTNVLKPLGMIDTHFQLPKSKIERFTTGYSVKNEKLVVVETPSQSRFANEVTFLRGGGGLVSTTNDYLKLCQMLLNKGELNGNRLLKHETIDLMTRDHLSDVRKHTKKLRLLPGETGFGLGFSIAAYNKNGNRGVYGWGGAVGTYFRIDPKNEIAYTLMIQLSPYRQLGLRNTFQKLVNNSVIRNSESQNKTIITPVLLDKSILSGINLDSIKLKDQPDRAFFQKSLYQGSEISAYMISSQTATKYFKSFPLDEFVYLMNGKAKLRPKNAIPYEFNTGDYIVVNKGFNGNWKTIGGNKYHLELSVVSNKRSNQKNIQNNQIPFKIDNDLISGVNDYEIENKIIYSGKELEITLEAEKPQSIQIINSKKEQFIHILSGMVKITPNEGNNKIFYTGDFFILPKGFNGKWQSEGHHLFRTLKVVSIL